MKCNLNSYCRLCLRNKGQMINIFDQEGCEQNICTKISTRLSIQVHEDDILPKLICIVCYGMLDKYDAFVNKVLENQARLMILYIKTQRDDWENTTKTETLKPRETNPDDVIFVENSNEIINLDEDDDVEKASTDSVGNLAVSDIVVCSRKRKVDQENVAINNKRICTGGSDKVINEIEVFGVIRETIDKKLDCIGDIKSDLVQELKTQFKNQEQKISKILSEHMNILKHSVLRSDKPPNPSSMEFRGSNITSILPMKKLPVNRKQKYMKVPKEKESYTREQKSEVHQIEEACPNKSYNNIQNVKLFKNADSETTLSRKSSDCNGTSRSKFSTKNHSALISSLFEP